MGIASLGYVTLHVTDMPAWLDLVTSVFGMETKPRPDGTVDLRIDGYHHRLTLFPSDQDRLGAIGWEVDTLGKLEALVADLRQRGLEVERGDERLKQDRKVHEIYSFLEPELGVETELFYGPLTCNYPLQPSRGIAGYQTKGLGLGHVVFTAKNPEAAVRFYCEALGFEISDYIIWSGIHATFLHCNPRHHTLAIMNQSAPGPHGNLHHILLESTSFDDVGYAYDIVRDRGIPLVMDMGKHSNDHMQSFYLKTPSGFGMEYGYGGRLIGPEWEIRVYDQPMLFGHRFVG